MKEIHSRRSMFHVNESKNASNIKLKILNPLKAIGNLSCHIFDIQSTVIFSVLVVNNGFTEAC